MRTLARTRSRRVRAYQCIVHQRDETNCITSVILFYGPGLLYRNVFCTTRPGRSCTGKEQYKQGHFESQRQGAVIPETKPDGVLTYWSIRAGPAETVRSTIRMSLRSFKLRDILSAFHRTTVSVMHNARVRFSPGGPPSPLFSFPPHRALSYTHALSSPNSEGPVSITDSKYSVAV